MRQEEAEKAQEEEESEGRREVTRVEEKGDREESEDAYSWT
jgi:hypothetical protein